MFIPSTEDGIAAMNKKSEGGFSANLLSLQLQLKTLLEESGGDAVAELLDSLCLLNRAEHKVILSIFIKVIQRIDEGEVRLSSAADEALREFEENLYREIITSMQRSAVSAGQGRFEVMDGGRSPAPKSKAAIVNIKELRRARKTGCKPALN